MCDFNLESTLKKCELKTAVELAKKLDVTPRTISIWKKAGKVSRLQGLAIQQLIYKASVKNEK